MKRLIRKPPIGSVYYAQPGQVPQPSSQPPAQQQPQSQHAGSVQQQAQSVCIQPQSQTLLPQVTGPSLPSSLPQSVPSTINQIMQSVSSSTTGVPPGGPVTVPSVSIVATAGETPSDIIYCS
ncbi:unnamed protein product [Protopolystoma xenopodis]|uniref:Uncharacterized protein n=1 Tax=Protopolystoma xenopodis TaxID=117903 RepID=A0A3S5BDI1_9PLAT|nr:unnamed protein product [Protopolystoma xenopodis]